MINNGKNNLNRDKVHSLVEVFYQPPFKTFYVNSIDGKTFVKPIGVFVSLGITTSMKVLEDMKNIISETDGYSAVLAEISSEKISNQFLNTLVKTGEVEQYRLTNIDDKFDESKAREELSRLRKLMDPSQDINVLKDYAPKVSRLQDLIDKLTNTNGWNDHMIQREDSGDYRIYHLLVNYDKRDNIEYRIGIFVTIDNSSKDDKL